MMNLNPSMCTIQNNTRRMKVFVRGRKERTSKQNVSVHLRVFWPLSRIRTQPHFCSLRLLIIPFPYSFSVVSFPFITVQSVIPLSFYCFWSTSPIFHNWALTFEARSNFLLVVFVYFIKVAEVWFCLFFYFQSNWDTLFAVEAYMIQFLL